MNSALLKVMVIAGAGGASIAPLVGKRIIGSTKREVFMIAQSSGGGTKLFLEGRKNTNKSQDEKFDLKVMYKGKEIAGQFLLCSPAADISNYYLLKWNGSWRADLSNEKNNSISDCDQKYTNKMGEKLTKVDVKKTQTDSSNQIPKEIDLKDCDISKYSENSLKPKKTILKLTCKEVYGRTKNIEIYGTGFTSI